MNLNEYKEKVIETVIEPMVSFMEDWRTVTTPPKM